jgi:Cys-tRNA(Pro) deacylase
MSFVKNNILRILDEADVDYELIQHEHIHTAQEACKVRGSDLSECIKSLIFKTKEGDFILVLVPGNKKADTKGLRKLIGTRDIHLASPEEVLKVAGCEIGSVGPFGPKTRLKTYMDGGILKNEYCYFSIGTHTDSIKMRPQDLEKVVKPTPL